MKTCFRSLLILCSFVAMISLSGCGEEPKPASMTEGVPLDEIKAYEQAVRDMEAEDAGELENINERAPEPPSAEQPSADPPAE